MSLRKILCVGASGQTDVIRDILLADGWNVHQAGDLQAARQLLVRHCFSVGLLVQPGLDTSACAALDAFLADHAQLEWVGAFDAAALVLPACRDLILAHLFDHHTLPLDPARVTSCLGHAHGRAALRADDKANANTVADVEEVSGGDCRIVGRSTALAELLRQVRRAAHADAPVLIHGESGSGKELIAQAVHQHSRRARGPFVAINCGAIQASLAQSELFGHEKGAFTGAVANKRGFFEAADGGTVFLDEVGDLPLELQVNLLRFLQEGTINRVGSTRVLRLDVRVVAASHVDLPKAVAEGRFREDLFYRLNVLPLHVAPLHERREDIKMLAAHFFRRFEAEKSPRLKGFSRQAILAMEAHAWPGNVRELINRVRCAMIMAQGKLVTPADLGLQSSGGLALENVLDGARLSAERTAIHHSLEHAGRRVAVAARHLGVSRMTLYRLMAKHGLNATQ